jgi:hypothetical protein
MAAFSLLSALSVLAVTSGFADQASMIEELRANPTADFSQTAGQTDFAYYNFLMALADADAMAYFQDHHKEGIESLAGFAIGTAHAFQHQLLGQSANAYAVQFSIALDALLTN